MSKTTRILKLLGDLSPEERQEILNEYKETNTDNEQQAQNTLKETDKGGSSDLSQKEETEVKSDVSLDKKQEQNNTNDTKADISETQTAQEPQGEDSSASEGQVGNEEIDPKYDGVAIQDFVLKKDLEDYLKSFESKLNALEDENKKLKEKLDTSNKENDTLKQKYEQDSFGDLAQRFEPKQSKGEDYESFDNAFARFKSKLK